MKLINRLHYLNQLSGVMNTPDIKILTGIRRSGKSKLLSAFVRYIRDIDSTANVIELQQAGERRTSNHPGFHKIWPNKPHHLRL